MDEQRLEELAREERNRYAREWRAKNKDRVKANNMRYWANRALKQHAASAGEEAK